MQRPPAVRPSRPSRHPTEFLTAFLLPPLNDSRAPSPTSSNPGPTFAGRPCRFGPGVSETTPVPCHTRAVIGGVALEQNTTLQYEFANRASKPRPHEGGLSPILSHSCGLPFNTSTLTPPPLESLPLSRWDGRAFPFVQQGFQGVVALGPRPLAIRSRSRSARGRDSDGERTLLRYQPHFGPPPPRDDYSFSPPVPPEPPLPGSERGSGG
ncbi:hypothetical protein CFIO01_10265 [Colletotrichum fioriniae PJ7]|uniref:Uncharacterized protein n=1 Tax=Colletotrichum fioriniae PJ7 TaxID=1445577 RepID=A0A010RR21_9PEZI|nr:hypothetical protein CFIO01_10265 [Colletotrichum fioriniae PJ7]